MKTFKFISIGMMLFFISCSTESYEGNEIKATNVVSSDNDECETGFAICAPDISKCFLDDGFNRWGWTIGPVPSNEYTHTYFIYTGAGQCEISKGQQAGRVWLNYDENTGVAKVTFIAEEGYVFKETHLYIGNDPYPTQVRGNKVVETVAPGQYPYKHADLENAIMDYYQVERLSGDIYLIAHAVVCAEAI